MKKNLFYDLSGSITSILYNRSYLAIIFVMAFLLSGCSLKQEKIPDIIPVTYIEDDVYTVTQIPFDEYANYESKGAYNNHLSLIEIVEKDGYRLRSSNLLWMDLADGSVEQVAIEKEDEANRIWDFVKLDDKKYLYTEISYVDDYLHYKTILQEQKKKTLVTEGNWFNLFSLPQFSVLNDTIYLLCASVDFANTDEKEAKNYEYRLELWKYSEDKFDCIYKINSRFINRKRPNDAETLLRPFISTNNNIPSFLTADNDNYYLNKVENDKIIKHSLKTEPDDLKHLEVVGLEHIVPINDYQLVTFWREDIEFPKNFNTYLYSPKIGYIAVEKALRLVDSCALDEWTVAYSELESDIRVVALRIVDQKIEILKLPETRYGNFFRKIDGNSLLIFDGLDKCYKVEFK